MALKARDATTYQVWILDTGASHHITADFFCLINPVSHRVGIEVGGGQVLYSQYKGNVCLSVLVAGKVSNFSLSDVLYLPGWNNMNFLSWRMIDLIGNTYLRGENKTLDIKLKTDTSIII